MEKKLPTSSLLVLGKLIGELTDGLSYTGFLHELCWTKQARSHIHFRYSVLKFLFCDQLFKIFSIHPLTRPTLSLTRCSMHK